MNKEEFKLPGFNNPDKTIPKPITERVSNGLNIPSGCGCED